MLWIENPHQWQRELGAFRGCRGYFIFSVGAFVFKSPSMNQDDFDIDIDNRPSRSQLKRDAEALQDLGLALVELPQAKLDRIELPEQLREAIDLARRITAHGGKRRQMQFIGKLMRKLDAEPIRAQLEAMQQADRRAAQRFHLLEALRDKLIAEGDDALGELLERYPTADRQHLRQLVRQAQQERDKNKPPASARSLFRYLRELDEPTSSG